MKKILLSTVSVLMIAGSANAGSLVEPQILPPLPAPVAANDWSGFYLGGMGSSDTGTAQAYVGGAPFGAAIPFFPRKSYGGFLGYNIQHGSMVYGAELSYTHADNNITLFPTAHQDYYADAKLRVGYSFGKLMAYGVAGFSVGQFDGSSLFQQTGYVYGVGADMMITDSLFVGVEYTSRSIESPSAPTGIRSNINAVALRAGWNF